VRGYPGVFLENAENARLTGKRVKRMSKEAEGKEVCGARGEAGHCEIRVFGARIAAAIRMINPLHLQGYHISNDNVKEICVMPAAC
jgi:hypothetical protein